MSCDIFVGDVGTAFNVTIKDCATDAIIDLSPDVTTQEITFKKPDGTVVTKAAVFLTDGSDGVISYVSIAGDIDLGGTWKIQGKIEGAGFENSSSIDSFYVKTPLIG